MKMLITEGVRYGVTAWAAMATFGVLLLALRLFAGMAIQILKGVTGTHCDEQTNDQTGNNE